MKNHIENKDWESVKDIGHSLKSSSRTFGAIGLSDISFQIEKFESNDEKEIDQLFQDFVSEYEAVKQLILTLQSESN
jgi:HPt (histidine-containing phosphotransfer) domain-containing protein